MTATGERASEFTSTVTERDPALFGVDAHVRSLVLRNYLHAEYRPGTLHDGSEGELYALNDLALQCVNRFDDPTYGRVREELAERGAAPRVASG